MYASIRCWLRLLALPALLALSACTSLTSQPNARLGLQLSPALLGQAISLQQHLKVERNGRIDELDAALEVDAEHLELVGLAFGQRVLSLHYDGKNLSSWRHLMLPAQVRAEDVLEDLQLCLWPADAISAALPAGWRVQDQGLRRSLYFADTIVATIDYSGMPRWSGSIILNNLRYQYRLSIQSVPSGP
ncbi:DUF3261 domain-containing protein [Undibacterium sp.]|uniref:DUF3261 domain-containing protein n=1 Tax=Undibacterium sp. TaxID=1914977 RepID=UPI0025FF63AF|nr:DUF3261 domain-containing protein [Undibacterium sp.]